MYSVVCCFISLEYIYMTGKPHKTKPKKPKWFAYNNKMQTITVCDYNNTMQTTVVCVYINTTAVCVCINTMQTTLVCVYINTIAVCVCINTMQTTVVCVYINTMHTIVKCVYVYINILKNSNFRLTKFVGAPASNSS